MRKPYMTKKRKEEYDLAYSKIDELKDCIDNVKIEMEILKKNNNIPEYNSHKKYLERLKNDLKNFKKEGWSIKE